MIVWNDSYARFFLQGENDTDYALYLVITVTVIILLVRKLWTLDHF